MDRSSEKEKPIRKERDSHKDYHHKDRERDKDRERGRDRDHKHRSKEHRRHRSKDRDGDTSGDDDDRHELDYHNRHRKSRRDREKSSDEIRDSRRDREKSYEREGSRERSQEPSHSYKRKDRGESEDRYNGNEKRVRVSDAVKDDKTAADVDERKDRRTEGRREKRKFEDRVKEEGDLGFTEEVKDKKEGRQDDPGNGRKRDRRRFEDKDVKVEEESGDASFGGSNANGGVAESSRNTIENVAPSHLPATKVSSISTTNENKGVNITGSHAVTGKSSTDGTSTAAGKSGNLSLDALAKAKKALQMQKEISEKLKKIPLLNKTQGSKTLTNRISDSKEAPSIAGVLPTPSVSATVTSSTFMPDSKPAGGMDASSIEAVKRAQELAAKMGFRQDPQFAPILNFFPGQIPQDVSVIPKPAKAPVLRLDALGREVDEQGNLVNVPKINTLSTLKVNINKQKKDAFQILKPELEVDPDTNPHFDPRMGLDKNKILRPKRMNFQFVEEGKWSKDAEIIKLKSQFGDAQAKELKTKQALLAKAKAEPNINPNLIEIGERVIIKEKPKEPIPEVEWWDVPILRSGNYSDIADSGSVDGKLKTEKITIYIEHPRPIEPPAEPAPPPPQPLRLTKKEKKKLKTQRRLAREKDRQEMIRQGILEPPKSKVKMSNLMRVLGSEATQDPTRLEMEIRSAAAEREQAHTDRNIARKLTPAERREKKERKLFDEPTTLETIVSVYKINDLSNKQNQFKVDINAHENRLTGCALIYDEFSIVVVEGGGKSIKRYGKLMLRRINWSAKLPTEDDDEEEDEGEEKAANKCVLVWQGSVAKPSFYRFFKQECRTEAAARKFLADAGVGHYYDLAANFTDEDQA